MAARATSRQPSGESNYSRNQRGLIGVQNRRRVSRPVPWFCNMHVRGGERWLGRDVHNRYSGAPWGDRKSGHSEDGDRSPSVVSLRGLDGLNFLMADVRDGFGPYLSVFLKGGEGWQPAEIGVAMAASSVAAACFQIPAGLMVDSLKRKRTLVAVSGLLVAAGCLVIAFIPKLGPVVAAQIMLGAASAIIPPAIAALSLGLVGRRKLDARVSRNEGFNHAGNFVAAALVGGIGGRFGYQWIFYLVCAFAVASAAVVLLIRPSEIDHELARGGEEFRPRLQADPVSRSPEAARPLDLPCLRRAVPLRQRRHAADGGPGAGAEAPGNRYDLAQRLHHRRPARHGRRRLVRSGAPWPRESAGSRSSSSRSPSCLSAASSFRSSTSPWRHRDPASRRRRGRNLRRDRGRHRLRPHAGDGPLQPRPGPDRALRGRRGRRLSNLASGFIVQDFGYPAGFLSLALIALCALAFFAVLMPETGPNRRDLRNRSDAASPDTAPVDRV